jgi:long-chain fatty acid transport protein
LNSLAIGLCCGTLAFAQNFYNSGASASAIALGGAYSPSGRSVLDAMVINPAGLALTGGPALDLGANALFAHGQFSNSVNSNAHLDPVMGVAPYGAFGMRVAHSRVHLGLSATPEMMTSARWRYADAPGGAGGVSYGVLDNKSAILALRSALGVGLDLGPKWSLGVTVGAVYNSNTLKTAYVFQSHPALQGLKTLLDLNTSGVGWNGSVGVVTRPRAGVTLGVAYKSRTTVVSKGTATGNIGAQLAKLGIPARPDFRYDAEVDNVLPQVVSAHVAWDATPRWRLVAQAEWINWKRAFASLPVKLTHGNNADINGLLASSSLNDSVPLLWKNQIVSRIGVERSIGESGALRAGYAHANDPVPGSTLTPLTAVIMRDSISAGYGYGRGRWRVDGAYSLVLPAEGRVQQSALKSGEYSNSKVRLECSRSH